MKRYRLNTSIRYTMFKLYTEGGLSAEAIAKRFSVAPGTVYKIIRKFNAAVRSSAVPSIGYSPPAQELGNE